VEDNGEITRDLEAFIKTAGLSGDPREHVHVAWICIMEDSRRVEQAEIEFVQMLAKLIPVVVVITKARADQGFRREVERLVPDARNVVRVRALAEELDDGIALPPAGLDRLVEVTLEVIPEGQHNAFVAAQKVDINQKTQRAHATVAAAAATAMAIAASPIPFSDFVLIAPVQLGMFARISSIFGMETTQTYLTTLLTGALGASSVSLLGRVLVSNALKFVPGFGTIAGAGVSAATAGTLTTFIGEAYIAVLTRLFRENRGEAPDPDLVVRAFKEELAG